MPRRGAAVPATSGRRAAAHDLAMAQVSHAGRRPQQRKLAAVPAPVDGEMPNITPVDAGDWRRMMLYSPPGWGKTSLIAQPRTLIIRSSMDLIPKRALKSGADQVICDTHESMLNILQYCQMMDPFPYDWVWWDCISIAQDMLLDDVWAATLVQKPGRAALTPQGGLDRGEYGRNMERIQQWVRHMVGCRRFHFGITAHPMEGPHPTNDEGGDLLRPYIQGKNMTEKICGYMNMVGFLEVIEEDKKKWRRLHFEENARFYAKDHYDAFPDGYIDNPTMPAIMAAVERAREGKVNSSPTMRSAGRRGQQTSRRGARVG